MKHAIKHYGTFGSPKIAEHVHFTQKVQWEREGERAWELAKDNVVCVWECGNKTGNSFGNINTWSMHEIWGTSMGTSAHGWAITFANVHPFHTMFVVFINS